MSEESQSQRAELLGELARQMQQLNGLSAAFFRAAAARMGVTVTDMQVIEGLTSSGPMTAGQLAELTGLTTGAITGMLNRLEEAGLVRRERDPEDARKVIVQLAPNNDRIRGMGPVFDKITKAWEEQTAPFDDQQIAFLVEFLKRGNAVARQELTWLREGPPNKEGLFSAPLGDVTSGQFVVSSGVRHLTLRADTTMDALYQARFEGPLPAVKVSGGVVTIRYPRRVWMLTGGPRSAAEVALNAAIPWQVAINGGAMMVTADLERLDLAGLEIKGGASEIEVKLPSPSGVVPIRVSGAASDITVRRPAGVAARVHLKGWVSTFIFDDQTFGTMGNDVRLQSRDYDATAPHYEIEVAGSASVISITTEG